MYVCHTLQVMTQVLMSYRGNNLGGSKQNIFIHITLQASHGDDDVTCQNADKRTVFIY
jgi:hypothetical protein